jgi:hypothetical protein
MDLIIQKEQRTVTKRGRHLAHQRLSNAPLTLSFKHFFEKMTRVSTKKNKKAEKVEENRKLNYN